MTGRTMAEQTGAKSSITTSATNTTVASTTTTTTTIPSSTATTSAITASTTATQTTQTVPTPQTSLSTQSVLASKSVGNFTIPNIQLLTEADFYDHGLALCVIKNVPKSYKSRDLRFYFSNLIEKEAFVIFHYRHRPGEKVAGETKTCMGYCLIRKIFLSKFLSFSNQAWQNHEEQYSHLKCALEVLNNDTKQETRKKGKKRDAFFKKNSAAFEKIKFYSEFSPPQGLPQGNIGTPEKTIKKMIDNCSLPAFVIKKLGINFGGPSTTDFFAGDRDTLGRSEDELEDWERYDALHDDVDNQQRNKERLFEEDQEVTWDKGSSGLVFYTDANYWADRAEEDVDVDDWDLDPRTSENGTGGQNPHWQFLDSDSRYRASLFSKSNNKPSSSNRNPRLLEGYDELKYRKESFPKTKSSATPTFSSMGSFEKHTKGIGSKILLNDGWNPSEGLQPGGLKFPLLGEAIAKRSKHEFSKKGNRNKRKTSLAAPAAAERKLARNHGLGFVGDQESTSADEAHPYVIGVVKKIKRNDTKADPEDRKESLPFSFIKYRKVPFSSAGFEENERKSCAVESSSHDCDKKESMNDITTSTTSTTTDRDEATTDNSLNRDITNSNHGKRQSKLVQNNDIQTDRQNNNNDDDQKNSTPLLKRYKDDSSDDSTYTTEVSDPLFIETKTILKKPHFTSQTPQTMT